MKRLIVRIFYFPLGFFNQLKKLGIIGSRDLYNKKRFKGAIIDEGCCIDIRSIIQPNVHLLENCVINNTLVGSYTYIGKNCLCQNVTIGKFCSIANEVSIGLGKHPTNKFSSSTLFYKKINTLNIRLIDKDKDLVEYENISIGNDVWIGHRAIILDGVSIGHGAIVGSNAIVSRDVPPYAIVGGVPARVIKYRFDEEKIKFLLNSKWWDMDLTEIKENMDLFNL
jgi:chloramphenicol O-acetyltransferase type B